MRVVSVPDRLVRDPATLRVVDADGIDIDPTDPTWARFLADGDVAEAPAPAAGQSSPNNQPDKPSGAALPSDVKD